MGSLNWISPPYAGRYALGLYGFRFPLFLTSTHMAFCFLALLPYHLTHNWEAHKAVLRRQWKGLAAIGAFLAAGISLNNVSLVYISLSLNQVIRCGQFARCGVMAVYLLFETQRNAETHELWRKHAAGSSCCIA